MKGLRHITVPTFQEYTALQTTNIHKFLPLKGAFIDIYLKGPRQDGLILEKIKENNLFILHLHFVVSRFNFMSF